MLRPFHLASLSIVVLLTCKNVSAQYIYTIAGGGKSTENIEALKISVNPRCVHVTSNGDIYFSDIGWHAVRKYEASSGKIVTIAGGNGAGFGGDNGPAIAAKLNDPSAVRVDATGKYLYIADRNNYRIRRVDFTTGMIQTYAGTGTAGYSGDGGLATSAMLSVSGLVLDLNGDLYFTDKEAHVIRKIQTSTGIVSRFAGNGTEGSGGDGGPALNGQFESPMYLAFDAQGNLYVTDTFASKVRKITTAGMLSTFAGTGTSGFSGDGGAATSAQLASPEGIALDQMGNVYVSDRGRNRIRKINASGVISTFAGNGVSNYQSDGVVATSTSSYALDIAVDPDGNLITAEGYFRLRKINSTTGIINTIIGNGSPSYEGDNGPATKAQLSYPTAVAISPNGDIYIADDLNYSVRKVDGTSGIISTVIGNGKAGFTANGSLALGGQLRSVDDIALDMSGNLYIVERSSNRVRKIDAATGIISTVAGTGVDAFSGDGGLATSATLSSTRGICIDKDGNIYISDNNRIRKIDAVSKTISTIAGTGAYGYSGDGGPATSALLYYPSRLAADPNGNIYFSDNYSHRIRKIEKASGLISTVAGVSQSRGFAGDGGLATSAKLDYPLGISVDNEGNLYIADTQNSRIRKVTASTGIITTIAGTGSLASTADGVLATAASLYEPEGIALDATGKIYIADTENDRIKVIKQKGALITFTKTVEVYSGSTKTISFTTDPPNLGTIISYDEHAAAPTNAGQYNVKVVSTDPQFPGTAFATFTIVKAAQTISFDLGPRALSDGGFDLNATSSSGLPVSYSILDPQVATVSGNRVTMTGLGATMVTASQPGNANYLAAEDVKRTLNVVGYTAILAIEGSLDFGEISIGESEERKIAISNSGTSALDITSVSVPVGFSVDKATLQVQPGASAELSIVFNPEEEREYGGKLVFTSNATSGVFERDLSGVGIAVTSTETDSHLAVPEVYPVPADRYIYIKTGSKLIQSVTLLHADGRVALLAPVSSIDESTYQADISMLSDGFYFLHIRGEKLIRIIKKTADR